MNPQVQQFLNDLKLLGYDPELLPGNDNQEYAVLRGFEVKVGRFAGRIVDLGLQARPDYPRMVGQSMQVKTDPVLLEKEDSIPQVRNIIDSPLGLEWRYWSYQFKAYPEETAKELLAQINGVFKRI